MTEGSDLPHLLGQVRPPVILGLPGPNDGGVCPSQPLLGGSDPSVILGRQTQK
eukprot:NODE_3228_length_960_cov_6.410538_g2683_i0.p5 GENE.NODE_3228_length_960_cov_6.410538_g2683_i0~~NODE_3228_length_960_cov_6.410538_g2683_i0.p5  ORF type:complete len:53 (-),score=2.21 NODE_3228_length_960_cov_6.410538_g2683_i0:440-598(-)